MNSQHQTAKANNPQFGNPERKKQFLKWLSSLKDIKFTKIGNDRPTRNKQKNQKKDRLPVIKEHIQDPNLYVWQDFLTIFQLTQDQVQKLNLLLPKGFSFISKETIPENIKIRLGHDARRMNLKRQYELKQAQQALKNPVPQEQFEKKQYYQHQQTTFQHLTSQNKQDQQLKKQQKQTRQKDFTNSNKVVLNLKKGQKVDDLSVFAHPIYEKMHNIVVFKRMLHPHNYQKQKEKQIKKQREKQRLKRIKEARKSKLKRAAERKRQQKKKQIELKQQHRLQKKDLIQRKNNRSMTLSKKGSNMKISLQTAKLNLQLNAIKELMQKLEKHQHFTVFQQGKTKPSMKFLLKMLAAKIQKNYKVDQFEIDLLRIFKIFYQTSKEKIIVIKNIRNLQKFMKNAIQNQKIIFTNPDNLATKRVQTKDLSKQMMNSKARNKKPEKLLKNKNQEYQVKEIQKLGKNVCRLKKRNIEQFCIQFCGQQSQKMCGEAFIFQFNFLKENSARLQEMQKFVRQKLEQEKTQYVELSDNDISEQFLIENDD